MQSQTILKLGMSNEIVLDAGPLIAVYSRSDRPIEGLHGYAQLAADSVNLIVPILILSEVHSWVSKREHPEIAQRVLANINQAATIQLLTQANLETLVQIIQDLPSWKGTLAEASVVLVAQNHHCPVWTLDYRDLGRFKELEFWTPTS